MLVIKYLEISMGLCWSSKAEQQVRRENERIQNILEEKKKEQASLGKVLMLGPGESGKSTMLRQMMLRFGNGIERADREVMIPLIRDNIIRFVALIATKGCAVDKDFELSSESKAAVDVLSDTSADLRAEHVQRAVKHLWNDPGVQDLIRNHLSKLQVADSLGYFIDRLDEIASRSYVPSDEDLIRVRVRTTGVIQASLSINGSNLTIVDVGGQRSERRKWTRQFEGLTAILFVAAAGEYDVGVYESEETNRMIEALEVFRSTLKVEAFKSVTFILFLNKSDVFERKVKEVSLSVCFSDWNPADDGDVTKAWTFLEDKFKSIAEVCSVLNVISSWSIRSSRSLCSSTGPQPLTETTSPPYGMRSLQPSCGRACRIPYCDPSVRYGLCGFKG